MKLEKFLATRKVEVDKEISRFFAQKIKQTQAIDASVVKAYKELEAMTLRGGKRGRPILMQLGYELAQGKKGKAIVQASVAYELLHKFFLIHDDIIDKDLLRYGGPTLEAVYRQKSRRRFGGKIDAEHAGRAMAIVLGDLSHDFAYEVLLSSDFPAEVKIEAAKAMQGVVLETAAGWQLQFEQNLMDIGEVNEQAVLEVIDLVSAKYTVAGPLKLGLILAGKEKQLGRPVEKLGMALGRAFQIQDDILGLFGEEKVTGKPVGNDVQEGKKTLLMVYAFRKSSEKQRKILRRALGNQKLTKSELRLVRKVVEETGSLLYSQREAQKLVEKAKKQIAGLAGKKQVKKILARLGDFMIRRKY